MSYLRFVHASFVALIVLAAPPARAQEEANELQAVGDRPWAEGVSKESQDAAWELFREGNALLKDSIFRQAVDKYRAALKHWDHPAIHYNLALALLNLDQPLEVSKHLDKAMAYGALPLEQDKYEHAKGYKALIEQQIATIEVACAEPGAIVKVDGEPLFTAPGSKTTKVRAGSHTIIATKDGFMTTEKTKNFEGGKTEQVTLKMYEVGKLTAYKRRWPNWQPWLVVGVGAAFLAGGGVLHWQASENFAAFDDDITACGGCVPSDEIAGKKSDAEMYRSLAIVSYGIGAAALVTGATLVYVNREKPYKINPVEREGVTVVPVIAPDEAGVLATFRF